MLSSFKFFALMTSYASRVLSGIDLSLEGATEVTPNAICTQFAWNCTQLVWKRRAFALAPTGRTSVAVDMAAGSPVGSGYIPHLDGIRALALLGVLGFHFDIPGFQGGYLGVDCFLTLSGYLMTRNILQSIELNSFSIKKFYGTRLLRLYPSAVSTALGSSFLAIILFPPDLALPHCQSVVSMLFFASNFYFRTHSSYFDVGALNQPLLHTWSLSLEEQFYALWPPMLASVHFAVRSFGMERHLSIVLVAVLGSVSLLSLQMAFWGNRMQPLDIFFKLPGRTYQFGFGGLTHLAQNIDINISDAFKISCATLKEFVSVLGTGTLLYCFRTKKQGLEVFPRVVVGVATSVLIATPSTTSSVIFGNRAIRYVGKLSYAMYLCHWPIWVFIHHAGFSDLTAGNLAGILGPLAALFSTSAVGTLTHLYVEQKYRPLTSFRMRKRLEMAILWLSCLSVAAYGVHTSGWRGRVPAASEWMSHQEHCERLRPYCLDISGSNTAHFSTGCIPRSVSASYENTSEVNTKRIFVGSSYGRHLMGAVDVMAPHLDGMTVMRFLGGCPLLSLEDIEIFRSKAAFSARCIRENVQRWAMFKSLNYNATIVVASTWARGQMSSVPSIARTLRGFGHTPVFWGTPPGMENSQVRIWCGSILKSPWRVLLFLAPIAGCSAEIEKGLSPARKAVLSRNVQMKKLCSDLGVGYVDVISMFSAEPGLFPVYVTRKSFKGWIYESDGSHLSLEGSLFIGEKIISRLDDLSVRF